MADVFRMIIDHSLHYLIEYFAAIALSQAFPKINLIRLFLNNYIQHFAFAIFKNQIKLSASVDRIIQLHNTWVTSSEALTMIS